MASSFQFPLIMPSTSSFDDASGRLQAAIDRASRGASVTGGMGYVELAEGDFYTSVPINHKSNVLVSGHRGRRFRVRKHGSWALTGADNYLNAFWKLAGATNTAKLNTTLTANAIVDAKTITVASAGTLVAGDWIWIQGTQYPSMIYPDSDAGLVIRRELVQVDSSYAGGTTIALAEPLMQSHASGNSVVAVTPLENAALVGADFYSPAGSVAVGVMQEYASRTAYEDISGEGLSRAVVNLVGSRDFEVRGVRGNGENNSLVLAYSPIDGSISGLRNDGNGKRFHSSGVARALLQMQFCPVAIRVDDLVLKHGCMGVFLGGGKHLKFGDVIVHDMDTAQALSTQITAGEAGSGQRMGAGWMSGAGPVGASGYAEFGHDVVVDALEIFNVRHDANGCAAYVHDTGYHFDRISIIQGSAVPGTMYGFVFSDTGGTIDSMNIEGVTNGIVSENPFVTMHWGTVGLSATPYGGGSNASLPLQLAHTSGSIQIEFLALNNYNQAIRFGGNFNDSGFSILKMSGPDVVTGEVAIRTDLIMAYNNTGSGFSVGELVKIDGMISITVGGQTRLYPSIVTPTGPGTANAVVAVGAPLDIGTGFMMICMLPAKRCTINVADANVTAGNKLESQNGSRLAVVNNSTTVPCAVALTSKTGSANTGVHAGPPTHT